MDGVTILRTYENISEGWFVLLFFAELMTVGFGALFVFIAVDMEKAWVALIITITTICLGVVLLRITPRVTRYEVALQDSVSWTEFTTRYEIKSIDGNILNVRDRTED